MVNLDSKHLCLHTSYISELKIGFISITSMVLLFTFICVVMSNFVISCNGGKKTTTKYIKMIYTEV